MVTVEGHGGTWHLFAVAPWDPDGYQSVTLYGKALVIRGILSRRSGGRGIGNLRGLALQGRGYRPVRGSIVRILSRFWRRMVHIPGLLEDGIGEFSLTMHRWVSSKLGQGVAVQIRAASHIQCRKTGSHMYGNNSHTCCASH